MAVKKKEKRKVKGYKISDKVYRKAMRRATKGKFALASLIETWVSVYAEGGRVETFPPVKPVSCFPATEMDFD